MHNWKGEIKYLDHFLACPPVSWPKYNEIILGCKKRVTGKTSEKVGLIKAVS